MVSHWKTTIDYVSKPARVEVLVQQAKRKENKAASSVDGTEPAVTTIAAAPCRSPPPQLPLTFSNSKYC